MQELRHSMGLMSMFEHKRLANREAIDESLREYGLPKIQLDLPTAHASDLPTLLTVDDAEASEHA